MGGEESLDQQQFFEFYQMVLSRPELDKLFKQYAIIEIYLVNKMIDYKKIHVLFYRYSVNNTCIMGPDELMDFLKTEQKV